MSAQDKNVKIKNREFLIQKLPALHAMRLSAQLAQLLAPVLEVIPGAGLSSLGQMSESEQYAMIGRLAPMVDTDKLISVTVALCETAIHSGANDPLIGQQVNMDQSFANDITDAYLLAFHVSEFNFAKYVKALMPAGKAT